jgi:3-dehydroquinate dehydratase-2|tara:strand:- start:1504 stop:1980 length:477 start_codon:yes stop_codon:yes gene_type:complete
LHLEVDNRKAEEKMNILVLHGPNMNLIGVRASSIGENITLDKINTALRREARQKKVTLKILQTDDMSKAMIFIKQKRKWADGCLIAPGAWARNGFDLLDTIQLCQIPTVEVHFSSDYDPSNFAALSIISDSCLSTEAGPPMEAYTKVLDFLTAHIGNN